MASRPFLASLEHRHPGAFDRLIDAWLDRKFTLISDKIQLDELREMTRRDKIPALVRPFEAGRHVSHIAVVADMPERYPPVERSRYPRDDFLFALYEAGKAGWW